jgi:hypothetical protein
VAAPAHPAVGNGQPVKQPGDRLVVTGGGVVHDMRCDGTADHGVDDVAEFDKQTRINVVAKMASTYSADRNSDRGDTPARGDDMIWKYVGFTARLGRIGGPDDSVSLKE